jgi:uncharacterized protein (DUF2236 family)
MNIFLKALGGEKVASAFRQTVSGDPTGVPQWALQMDIGDDAGFFGPESDVWKVHGSLATLVGGVRALLMQAAYPAALAGVSQHSRYDTDPLGRLERTTRWLTITSFGSTEVIEREAARVRAMHDRVSGEFTNPRKEVVSYSANQEHHLLWVHCAFTDSFLTAYRELDRAEIRDVPNYVAEWAKSAEPLGLKSAPMSDAELEETINTFLDDDLGAIKETESVVHFILHPPFSKLAMPFYRLLCNAAISTMDPRVLALLDIKPKSRIWLKLVKPPLRVMQMLLGEESPSQTIARARIARINSVS